MTRRLLLSYLSVTALVLLLLEIPLGLFYQRWERERLFAGLAGDASVLATIYEDALELTVHQPGATPVLDGTPATQYQERTGARVVVVDRAGISLIDTEQPAPRDLSGRPEITVALDGRSTTGTRYSETLRTDLFYVAVPVASGGAVYGAVRVSFETAQLEAHVRRFYLGLAAVAVVVLATMTFVGWVIARSISSPVTRLRRAAEQYASGDLTAVVAADRDDPEELRALSDTMATMAERLAGVLQEQRAFVADASHQLRTPLTALRLRLENLQPRVADREAADLESAIEETDRLSSLVNDLLALARTDRLREVVTVALDELAAERVDTWGALAEAHAVRLALLLPAPSQRPALVRAVPGALEQILDNVLDNALAVSPAGATIEVGISPAGSGWALSVTDAGPGLSDEDKQKALRRFWRGDSSRPGSGLGLAIAGALAAAGGGSLELQDNPAGPGLRAVVRLEPAIDATARR